MPFMDPCLKWQMPYLQKYLQTNSFIMSGRNTELYLMSHFLKASLRAFVYLEGLNIAFISTEINKRIPSTFHMLEQALKYCREKTVNPEVL